MQRRATLRIYFLLVARAPPNKRLQLTAAVGGVRRPRPAAVGSGGRTAAAPVAAKVVHARPQLSRDPLGGGIRESDGRQSPRSPVGWVLSWHSMCSLPSSPSRVPTASSAGGGSPGCMCLSSSGRRRSRSSNTRGRSQTGRSRSEPKRTCRCTKAISFSTTSMNRWHRTVSSSSTLRPAIIVGPAYLLLYRQHRRRRAPPAA